MVKRSPLKRKTWLRSVNRKRAKARKARDFGPYADWIRDQICVAGIAGPHGLPISYCLRPAQAAHVRSRGAGGPAIRNLVPLCARHHQEQHQIGIRSFQKRYAIDLKDIATRLWAAYQSENGAP